MTTSLAGLCNLGLAPALANDLVGPSAALTATASGTAANSLVLTAAVSYIATVTTTNDSVTLPVATLGAQMLVLNFGAQTLKVFANGTDTINATAGATGLTQTTNVHALFVCPIAGKWARIMSA